MDAEDIAANLKDNGFVFLPGDDVAVRMSTKGRAAWADFAASWDDLGEDLYMADGGRYRRRRHAVFDVGERPLRMPAQPHYQSRDYNPLNGGVERWFDPVTDAAGDNAALDDLVALSRTFIAMETGDMPGNLIMEMHQFRIEALADQSGQPTPEGMHRDGVDWVMVVMVNRDNVAEGETRLSGPDRKNIGAFTLTMPMDLVFLDDWRVFHGVTPVRPLNPERPGARDVLVLTFRRQDL